MICVLYVDDEASLLEVGKAFLEMTGEFHVETAGSAKEALTLMNTHPVDALVSDYQMPEMDGIQLLRAVRSCDKSLPFILFTGRGREEVVIEAYNSGVNFYLQKGHDFKSLFVELRQKIVQAVEKRKAEEDVQLSRFKARLAMDLAQIASWEYDRNTKLLRFDDNFYSLYGTTAAEEGGYTATMERYIERFVHPEDSEKLMAFVMGGGPDLERGEALQTEHRILTKAGEVRWVAVRVGAFIDERGCILKVCGVNQDITDTKRMKERA